MPGARRTAVDVAVFRCASELFSPRSFRDVALTRRDRLENRIEPLDSRARPANHHAVAAVYSPYSAARAHVDVVNALALEFIGPAHVIFEIRVAAVDDGVASLHVLRELLHRRLSRAARRNHDPDSTGRRELADQIFKRSSAARALARQLLHGVGAEI